VTADPCGTKRYSSPVERSRTMKERETQQPVSLPGEPIGHVMVFRVFDKIAYGLIVDAYKAVTVGDDIVNP
jgi:hypothetical protein